MIANQSRLPEHLIALPAEQWALWRCVGLRGAGFPVTGVLKLAASECARIADDLVRSEEEAEQSWEIALNALSSEIDQAAPAKLDSLERAMKQLAKGRPPQLLEDCQAKHQLERFAVDCEKAEAISQEFYRSFESALENISESINEIVRLEAFREAITWQNHDALHRGIDFPLESAASQRSRRQRRREELVASYWQRYCTKNDTIGFFGPVGWASFNTGPNPINIHHGDNLIALRNAYFESWCIDVLAEKLAANKSLQPWIAPRRAPFINIDRMMLQFADGSTTPLSAEEAALLKLCDGARTAKEIAEQLLNSGISRRTSVDDVYLLLSNLSEREIVSWTLQVPLVKHPELALRKLIERIEDDDLRAQSLEVLFGLESAFERVAASAGDAQRLDRSLEDLEAFFINATGTAATKDHGKTYAGRTLVFEDCVRDTKVELGPQLLESLSQPLLLLLTSARWLVAEITKEFRSNLEQIYRDLARQTGNSRVPAPIFWARAQALLFGSRRSIDQCLSNFQRKWAEVISIPADTVQLHYTSDELKARVASTFAVDAGYRNYFRYHSPDIMIAAPSVEAMCRDDYLFVMGELHLGLNTLSQSVFVNQHPEPEKFSEAVDWDLPEPRLVPVLPKFMSTAVARSRLLRPSPKDFFLELALDSPSPSRENTLLIGDLIIEDQGVGPIVSTRDGRLQFDIIQTFTEPLTGLIMNSFKILPPMEHSPRITIDQLVVCRESWAFSPLDLEFAFEPDESFRFINARRWASNNHLPRFIYFKSSIETKPCFVDLDSPIYVNTFAKIIRRTVDNCRSQGVDPSQQLIGVTEMLPRPDQAWLTDGQGNRYTCEFRIIALDRS